MVVHVFYDMYSGEVNDGGRFMLECVFLERSANTQPPPQTTTNHDKPTCMRVLTVSKGCDAAAANTPPTTPDVSIAALGE